MAGVVRLIALLRGINLGPSRRVPMPALREALTQLAEGPPQTLVQSGNVVLDTALAPGDAARAIERLVEERFGVVSAVVVRTAGELEAVVQRCPLPVPDDPRSLQVTFFAASPGAEAEAAVAAAASPPEEVAVVGREAYALHPDGVRRSRLARVLADERHGGTARNWRTVCGLLGLARR